MQETGNPQGLQLSHYLLFKKLNNLAPVQLIILKTFHQQPKLDQGLPNYLNLSVEFCLLREAGAEQQPEKFGFYLRGAVG